MKHSHVNLTKHVRDLSGGNCKTLMKKTEELNPCRDIPCSWMGRLNTVSSPQLSPEVQCNQNLRRLLGASQPTGLKVHMEKEQNTQNSQHSTEGEEQSPGLTLLNFKTRVKAQWSSSVLLVKEECDRAEWTRGWAWGGIGHAHTWIKCWKENAARVLAGLRNPAWEVQQRSLREQNFVSSLTSAVSLKLF